MNHHINGLKFFSPEKFRKITRIRINSVFYQPPVNAETRDLKRTAEMFIQFCSILVEFTFKKTNG